MTAHNAEVRAEHASSEIPVQYKNSLQIHAMQALGETSDPLVWMEKNGTLVENALDAFMIEKNVSVSELPPEKTVLPYVLEFIRSHRSSIH